MEVFKFNNINYYNSKQVKKKYPKIFRRCKKIRFIITVRKLKEKDYCYAYKRNDKWKMSNEKYTIAILFLTKQYIDDLIKKLNDDSNDKKKNEKQKSDEDLDEESSDEESSNEDSSDEDNLDEKDNKKNDSK